MKIFGIEIKRSSASERPKSGSKKLLGMFLNPFQYGREYLSDQDQDALLRAFRSWVYTASMKNAETVAQTPIRLYYAKPSKNTKKYYLKTVPVDLERKRYLFEKSAYISSLPIVKKAYDIEEVIEHPFLDLMKSVNGFMGSFDLWEMTQLHQELTGNAYWLIVENVLGLPMEIWPIPPNKIAPIPDKQNFVSGYLYTNGSEKLVIPENRVIHFKMPNPKDMYLGMSPLSAVAAAYNINENMAVYENSVFSNMGRLDGYWHTDQEVDEDAFSRIQKQIKEMWTGVKNAGKTPFVDKGMKFEKISMSPSELSYLDGREKIKEEILNAYGQNLALYDKSSTRANAEAAMVMFTRGAIRPRLIRNDQKLNDKLIRRWGENIFVAFDDPVPEDRMIALKERSENIRSGATSINEERKKMRMPPFKDGDEPLIQVQYAPLSAIVSGKTLRQSNVPEPSVNNDKPEKMDANVFLDNIIDAIQKKLAKNQN